MKKQAKIAKILGITHKLVIGQKKFKQKKGKK